LLVGALLVGALLVGALPGAALLNRLRVHTDRLVLPVRRRGPARSAVTARPGGSLYRCAGE
jgi:hypothetical protein